MTSSFKNFARSESAGGIALALAAIVAMLIANSRLGGWYAGLLDLRFEVRIADSWLVLSKPLAIWVNELWMAVFFLLVGLEIKREVVEGGLSEPSQVALPIAGAIGGMAVPPLN